MMSLWSVAAAVILLLRGTTWPPVVAADDSSEDQDLVQEFGDLFSEFLRGSPKKQDRGASKHIRDTSKVDRRRKVATEVKPAEEADNDRPKLSPMYSCNFFDSESRLCANVRQVGTTLTIGVRVEGTDHKGSPPVHWYRVFVVRGRGDQEEQFTFVQFTRDGLPWNVNIGGENNELRISPITEIDFSYNFFLATLDEGRPGKDKMVEQKKGHRQLLMFSIEPISIDMGPLYHGEEITVNVRSHVELPTGSVRYEWARVVGSDLTVSRNLPSNMRLNRDASALVVKEHRDYGDDVTLTCAVYSNRNVTLARRNFFLRKIAKTPSQNARKGFSGPTFFRRRRRFLDEFYAQGRSRTVKRDNGEEEDNFWNEGSSSTATPQEESDTFPTMEELFDRQESTSRFFLEDKPKETVLNFYGKQEEQLPFPEFPAFKHQEGMEPGKQTEGPLDELMVQEANGFLENKKEDFPEVSGRVNIYATTVRIAPEGKPTFEDRESMLIADCHRDSDCGANAFCARIEGSKRFCRCKPHYRGNGLFCWLF